MKENNVWKFCNLAVLFANSSCQVGTPKKLMIAARLLWSAPVRVLLMA